MLRVFVRRAMALAACGLLLLPTPASAADKVRITGLSDVSFGTITSFAADSVRTQSLCLFAQSPPPPHNYRITASGSGSGGAFDLNSGGNTLPYEVQWSDAAGQTSGSQLSPNAPLTGLASDALQDDCRNGPATTASLIIILRSAAVAGAISGNYTGTLTLVVAPE